MEMETRLDDPEAEGPLPPAGKEASHPAGGNVEQPAERSASLSSVGWVILCSSMLLAEVQAAIDSTMTANLQPTVIHAFGEISKFPWINVSYSLGLSGSCLVW